MKVLVACEFSGAVRDAFIRAGHDAWSCDILPTDKEGQHYQCDVREVLNREWDMMIAFPPCTHLAVSGAKHFAAKRADGRQQEAIDFFLTLAQANIPKIAIENPVGIMSKVWRKPDQIIQPWQFGEQFQKKTCLWLKNLPLLQPTKIVDKGEFYISPSGKKLPRWYCGFLNGKQRSKTFKGIANAMAEQWGKL